MIVNERKINKELNKIFEQIPYANNKFIGLKSRKNEILLRKSIKLI